MWREIFSPFYYFCTFTIIICCYLWIFFQSSISINFRDTEEMKERKVCRLVAALRYSTAHRYSFVLWISPSADACHSPAALKRKFYRLAAASWRPSAAGVTDEVEAQRRQSAVAMGIATPPPINNNGKRLPLLNSRYLPSIIIGDDATSTMNTSQFF